jgi:hypothetical protein
MPQPHFPTAHIDIARRVRCLCDDQKSSSNIESKDGTERPTEKNEQFTNEQNDWPNQQEAGIMGFSRSPPKSSFPDLRQSPYTSGGAI